jgi:glutaredoxin 2
MSKYNVALLKRARELKQFAEGSLDEVDLSEFATLSARKHWADKAEILEGHVVNTVNAHTVAVGKVLYALGYRGPFAITKDLRLVKEKQTVKKEVTIEDIIKAAVEE